ncbi:uncharacterized protein LOC131693323 [Topomyia yanbarensis]|uniref:uncharacterized protein LOC131693323 n=1 Tax=Topomyia yanbarensis TaxID=2498891 RepID=UPI00273AB555|nr:uncharacterized protein LOC131693323 [Topomyia yanbarensis]XP_058837031.1 uncharacterized protein LOC131693323 [Topomyia yanbarensis]
MEANFQSFSRIKALDESLQNAIKLDCLELVQRAIDRGANIDCQYPDDWNSPLHLAVLSECHDSLILLLMNHRPTCGLVNGENLTAAELAFRNGQRCLGRKLIEVEFGKVAPEDAFYQLLRRSSVEALEVLIEVLGLPRRQMVECLAKAWGKLEVMNVKLLPELELFAQLLIIRFDYEESLNAGGAAGSSKISQQEVAERMGLVVEGIDCLEQKYDTGLCDDVNDEFLENLRGILKHLFFVKNRVENFPVLQLEFCVAIYLAIFDRRPELDLFQLVIYKCLVVKFLKQFKKAFLDPKKNDGRMSSELLYDLMKLVATNRNKKCKEILATWISEDGVTYSSKEKVMIRNKILACSLINNILSVQYSELTKEEHNILKTECAAINRLFETRKVRFRFKDLFRIYFKLKQMYSLQKAIACLAVIEKIELDPYKNCYVSMLAIQRALQVLGETLKSTKLSPNISTNLRSAIEFLAPGDILNRITKLRHFFSHEYSSSKHSLYNRLRVYDEELIELYKRIRADLMKVTPLLTNIYVGQIEKSFNSFIGSILQLGTVREVQSLAKACRVQYGFKIDFDLQTTDVSGIDELLRQLEGTYNNFEHEENLAIVAKVREMLGNYTSFVNRTTIDFMTALVISSIGILLLNETLEYQRNFVRYLLKNSHDPRNYQYGVKSLIMHSFNKEIQRLMTLEASSVSVDSMSRVNIIQNLLKLASSAEIDSMHELVYGKSSCNNFKTTQKTVTSLQLTLASEDLLFELDRCLGKYYANLFALDEKYRTVKAFCKRHMLKYSNEKAIQCRREDMIYYRKVFDDLIGDLAGIIALPADAKTTEIVSLLASVESYQMDSPDVLAVEIILLEILEVLSTLGVISDNRASMSCYRPVLTGRNLRNYLAHDALVYETFCRNKLPYRTVVLNAICFCRYLSVDVYRQSSRGCIIESCIPVSSIEQWMNQILREKILLFQLISKGEFNEVSEMCEIKARTFSRRSVLESMFDEHSEEFVRFLLERPTRMKPLFEMLLRAAPNQVHNFYDEDEFTIRQLTNGQSLRQNVNFYLARKHHHFELEQELDSLYGGAYTEDSLHLAILFRNERSALAITDCPRLYAFCKADAHRFSHTILAQAVLWNLPAVVRRICELSPEIIEQPNNANETALFLAVSVGHRESVEILMEFGAKVHTPNAILKSPVVYAAKMRKDDLLQLLLPSDDDLSKDQDLLGEIINNAGYANHHQLLRRLIPLASSSRPLINSLNSASTKNHLESIKVILDFQPSLVNTVFENEQTALFNACYVGSRRTATWLLRHGADCNIPDDNSALFCAVNRNQRAVFKLCITENWISAKHRGSLIEYLIQKSKFKLAWMVFEAGYPCSVSSLRKVYNDRMLDFLLNMSYVKPEIALQFDGFITTNAILLKKEKLYSKIIDANYLCMSDIDRANLLNSAIKANDKKLLSSLIARGCDANQMDEKGITPLGFAVSLGKPELVKLLLKAGADPNRESSGNCDIAFTAWSLIDVDSIVHVVSYPIILAIFHDHLKIVEFLLQKGTSADVRDRRGLTALIMAISKGYAQLVQSLIARGASVEYAFNFRHSIFETGTAVHAAAYCGHVEVISLLIEQYGFDPATEDDHGNTILHCAIVGKQAEVADYLVSEELWTTANRRGITPVHLVLRELDQEIFQHVQNRPPIIESILSFRDGQGRSVLHLAASRGSVSGLRKLLNDFSFDVNHLDQQGNTPIYYAVQCRDYQKIKLLIENGASLFHRNGEALILAVNTHQIDVIQLCIEQNANNVEKLKAYRLQDDTLIHICARKGNIKLCELLLNSVEFDVNAINDSGNTALHLATTSGTVRMTDLLLRYGAQLDIINKDGKTSFIVAIELGNVKLAQYLLAKGASKQLAIQFRYPANQGMCLLHHVAKEGKVDSVRFLIESSFFERAIPDSTGKTIGHYAATNNRGHVIEFLIATGFPIDLLDNEGRSSMVCSIEMGHLKIARRMKTIGCSIKIVQHYNEKHSLLDRAISEKKAALVEFLQKECYLTPDHSILEQLRDGISAISTTVNKLLPIKSPLHLAIENNKMLDIERIITKYNLSPDVQDSEGQSPLHYSCKSNNSEAAKKLLALGATIDLQDNNKATPLVCCLLNGNSKLAEILIQAGASMALVSSYRVPSKDEETVLHVAARKGFPDVVRLLLKINTLPVDVGDKDLTTALQEAAMYGQMECVNLLLENGADPNFEDLQGTTSLTRAISGFHRVIAELLLDRGVDLENSRAYRWLAYNESLLHAAILHKRVDFIDILIKRVEIDVNITDKRIRTPLHYAAELGLNKATEILLENNARWDLLDDLQATPLILATLHGHCETAELLLRGMENPVNIDTYRTTDSQKPLLHVAFDNGFYKLLVQMLTKFDLDFSVVDTEGKTVLHYAVRDGITQVIEQFFSCSQLFFTADKTGSTPLGVCIERSNTEVLETILNGVKYSLNKTHLMKILEYIVQFQTTKSLKSYSKWLLNNQQEFIRNNQKIFDLLEELHHKTSILIALMDNDIDLLQLLLTCAVDKSLFRQNEFPMSYLHVAASQNFQRIAEMLITQANLPVDIFTETQITPLIVAALMKHMDMVKVLLKYGANVNHADLSQRTPLLAALENDCKDMVQLFLDHGADVDLVRTFRYDNDKHCTVLHFLAVKGFITALPLVLGSLDVNCIDSHGMTPLHYAASSNQLEMIEFLADSGATIDCTDKDGTTPLMRAASKGNVEVFRKLVELGASINLLKQFKNSNYENETVLHLTAEKGLITMTKLLIEELQCDVDCIDKDGNTPLHYALKKGHFEVVKYFLAINTNMHLVNNAGETVLQLLEQSNNAVRPNEASSET